MHIKWAGEARLRSGELADIVSRSTDTRAGHAPLPTGWRGLDIATDLGGLPRSRMVTLTGNTDEQARNFVVNLIGHWQDVEHAPIAVVDLAADFAKDKVRGTGIAYQDLTVVRTNELDEAVEAARLLLGRADHDAVLLHSPSLDDEPEDRFIALLRQFAEAVRNSPSAGLVNLGQKSATPTKSMLGMRLGARRTLTLAGAQDVTIEVPADDRGRPDRVQDLVSGALFTNLAERTGRHYQLLGGQLVRSRRGLEQLLTEDSDLALTLANRLDREAAQRRWAALSEVDTEAGDADSPAELPATSAVNTWFEADAGAELPLRLGRVYAFNVSIGRPEIHTAGTHSPLQTQPDFGGKESVSLIATVHSRDFAVAVRTRPFELHRTRDSDVATFAVVPKRAGESTLRLTISTAKELELLHKVELSVPTESERG